MRSLKSTSIAVAMLLSLSLFGMVNSSQAFEIEEIRPFYYNYDLYQYGGTGVSHYTYVKTSKPFYSVTWYVDGVYAGYNYGGHKSTETSNYFYIGEGSISGTYYTVKAEACMIDAEGNTTYASDSYKIRVFQPKIISGTKYPRGIPEHQRGTGIYGSVELTRHYHDGHNIVVEGSVYASNGTKEAVHAVSWFRHMEPATGWQRDDPPLNEPNPGKRLSPGETYDNSGSSMITYDLGRNINEGETITLNAHIHLVVGGVVWHEENNAWTHTFDKTHNKDYDGEE